MKPKPISYWKRYDLLYKNYSKKDMFRKLKHECKKLGKPYKKKDRRGRKSKFSSIEYTAFICLHKIFRKKYREMELESTLYLKDKADHSTFARNYDKIPETYIEMLIANLVNKKFIYWIADSTGISTTIRVERLIQGTRNKAKLRDKLHLIVGYDPPSQTTFIIGAKATDYHISDSQGAIQIINNQKSESYILGDSAYDSYALHELVKEKGLIPVIKPMNNRVRKPMSARAKAKENFNLNMYQELRGVVETVFGGATICGIITSFSKKTNCRRLDSLMIALRHNLLASIRLSLRVFYATNSIITKPF